MTSSYAYSSSKIIPAMSLEIRPVAALYPLPHTKNVLSISTFSGRRGQCLLLNSIKSIS